MDPADVHMQCRDSGSHANVIIRLSLFFSFPCVSANHRRLSALGAWRLAFKRVGRWESSILHIQLLSVLWLTDCGFVVAAVFDFSIYPGVCTKERRMNEARECDDK